MVKGNIRAIDWMVTGQSLIHACTNIDDALTERGRERERDNFLALPRSPAFLL